ncbi:MAG TPA: hypothetical protein VFH56_07025, partial [Acidimicrobiales bacterium]|nr:hypothetical protein [Acidimicrobiales bacterium]
MSTVTRRRPSSKPAPARRSSAKAAPARNRRSCPRPSLRAGLAHLLGRQTDDVWGLALLVAAGLCALGVYSSLAGPAGRILDRGAGDVFGWCRFLRPPAVGTVSLALLRESHDRSRRRRPPPRPDGEERVARPPSRVAFGA